MNQINFIHVLRAFAAFLIINSHSDKLFPEGLSALGTGGSIGNAIFFFTSGYTLSLGIRKNTSEYLPWLKKRLVRLYPSFVVFMLFSFLVLKETYHWYDWILFKGSWFLQAIVVYYVIFFPIIKYLDNHLGKVMAVNYLLFAAYFLFTFDSKSWTIDLMDNPTRIHWVYYFLVMLLGAIVSKRDSLFEKSGALWLREKRMNLVTLTVILGTCVVLFYMPKLLFAKFKAAAAIQFVYPVLLVAMTYPFYLMSVRVSNFLKAGSLPLVNQSLVFLSFLTLDVYIVHFSIVHAIGDSDIIFPVNYIFANILIVLCSYILNRAADRPFNVLLKRIM